MDTSGFEDWQEADAAGLVRTVAIFNALHWIDPGMPYAKPTAILAHEAPKVVGSGQWARPADAEPYWSEVSWACSRSPCDAPD